MFNTGSVFNTCISRPGAFSAASSLTMLPPARNYAKPVHWLPDLLLGLGIAFGFLAGLTASFLLPVLFVRYEPESKRDWLAYISPPYHDLYVAWIILLFVLPAFMAFLGGRIGKTIGLARLKRMEIRWMPIKPLPFNKEQRTSGKESNDVTIKRRNFMEKSPEPGNEE